MKIKLFSEPACLKLQEIFLRLDDGNGVKLLVDPHETLDSLIRRIRNGPLLIPKDFNLVYLGKHIKSFEKSLKELGVQDNGIIHIENIIPNSIKQIQIDICVYYKEETMIVKSKSKDTIGSLKQKLSKMVNLHPKHQIIVFRGKQLDNQKTLDQYHVKANSLLCLTSETDTKEPETVIIPCLTQQAPEPFDCINSVRLKERKSSKEMFRSEVFEGRPGYEIAIQQKDDFHELYDTGVGKQFCFEMLYPKISEVILEKRSFIELNFSCDFDSESSYSVPLNQSKNLFKKNHENIVVN